MTNPADTKEEEEEEQQELSDADVLSCALGYFLDDIQNIRKKPGEKLKRQNDKMKYINYITFLSGEADTGLFLDKEKIKDLPIISNLLTKKEEQIGICDLNIFNNFKDNQLFFNQVVPFIKLYKVFETSEGYKELEIPFDIVAGGGGASSGENFIEKLLEGGSGNGAGISSFSWKSEGKNEGNNTVYTVTFKIILQNISELERVRNTFEINNNKKIDVTLLDLLYPPRQKNKFTDDPGSFEPEKMFIKADVGWNLPIDYNIYKNFFQTSLYLYLYKHNFSFQDSGRVELDLTYIGNIETLFNDKTKYDIFASKLMSAVSEYKTLLEQIIDIPKTDEATLSNLAARSNELSTNFPNPQYYNINISSGTNTYSDQAKALVKKLDEEIVSKLKVNFFTKILKELIDNELLYTIKLEPDDFKRLKGIVSPKTISTLVLQSIKNSSRNLNSSTTASPLPYEGTPDLEKGTKREEGIVFKSGKYVLNYKDMYKVINNPDLFGGPRYINYVYLDDLLEIIIKQASFIDKNINLFFNPYSYRNYKNISSAEVNNKIPLKKVYINNKPKYYKTLKVERKMGNLAHIPISLDVLMNWYNDEIIKSNETSYSFFEFLKKCFNTLIPQSIGSKNAPNAPEQNVLVNSLMFNTTKEQSENFKNNFKFRNLVSENLISIKDANIYYNQQQAPMNTKGICKNIYFVSTTEDDMTRFQGDKEKDCEVEVLHLAINDIQNIIKKVNFKRDDNQKLETANLLAANDNDGNRIIRQVYHCDIELMGNNFFQPGNLIYIKPNYPGVSLDMKILYEIGLGGYYRIISIENNIGVGSYVTNVHCRWEMFGGGINPSDIIAPQNINENDIIINIE